jgi:hypothetical protein
MISTDELMQGWAAYEFAEADLGDARRTQRLIDLAETLGQRPTASLPEACGDLATLKAAYRFFDNDDIPADAILTSHAHATDTRLREQPLVLAVQDTVYLDWTHHPATEGLGPLVQEHRQGLLAHNTVAITPERVPLGILQQQVWARDAETFGQSSDAKQRPTSEKESQKWLESLEAVNAVRERCPDTQFVSVGDSEADMYDLFAAPRPSGVDLLIRACQNRCVADDHEAHYLWDVYPHARRVGTTTVHVPRQEERPARVATLTVATAPVTLQPPQRRAKERLSAVDVWAVWVVEDTPTDGDEPIVWLLLTTVPVTTWQEALERLAWYACRWGIEVWHNVRKSGCQIEARQLGTAARLERCLALSAVIAWRIVHATMLARALPDAPCTAVLADDEWQALWCARYDTDTPPDTPPTIREAVREIAHLGGFLGRKHDGEPGVTVIWKGWQRLVEFVHMYRIMRPHAQS